MELKVERASVECEKRVYKRHGLRQVSHTVHVETEVIRRVRRAVSRFL